MSAPSKTTGMLVVITDPEGVVQAGQTDFNTDHPGGFRLEEMQERRAEDAAWREVLAVFCGRGIDQAITQSYSAFQGVKHRLKMAGWHITAKPISMALPVAERDEQDGRT